MPDSAAEPPVPTTPPTDEEDAVALVVAGEPITIRELLDGLDQELRDWGWNGRRLSRLSSPKADG